MAPLNALGFALLACLFVLSLLLHALSDDIHSNIREYIAALVIATLFALGLFFVLI